jgi:membrane protein involved in colicin uptake
MKYIACFSIVITVWCCMAVSAESTDADTQRKLKELQERIAREPPLDREEVNAYVASIDRAIRRHIVYPPASGGKRCIASVTQDKSGKVVALQLSQCESGELASAVRAAVRAASPLPLPSDMTYFERNLRLTFIAPNGR